MRQYTHYVADFETTVYKGQEFTEVWSAGIVEMYTENVLIFNSIEKFLYTLFSFPNNCIIWFHNLAFDGSFILDWLKKQKSYSEKLSVDDSLNEHMEKDYKLRNREYIYQISDKGVFYSITIKYHKKYFVFYDSYKLIPFSLSQICKAFDTKHKKLNITYEGERHAHGIIKDNEKRYQINDVLSLKEAIEYMFDYGFTKSTIGSNCMAYFKKIFGKENFNDYFPQLYDMEIEENVYGEKNAGEYVKNSYRGAWTYVKEDRKDIILKNGITVDANSLYPSVMLAYPYPVGHPVFFYGDIPEQAYAPDKMFFVRIKIRFELKEGHLPFIQIKRDMRYNGREHLKTSKIYDNNGNLLDNPYVILTVTQMDYFLIIEHYHTEIEILDGCYFQTEKGIFDEYINHFGGMKINAKNPVERTIAKLALNNLYGRFSMYHDSSFKVGYIEDGVLKFRTVEEHAKTPAYIAIGSAITSYARRETITKAQQNYDVFCYADTDSLHCTCEEKDLNGVPIDDKRFGFWKVEMHWKRAIFHRAKSYIETYIDEEGIEQYNITCAGMGKKAKKMFELALKSTSGMIDEDTGYNYKDFNLKQMDFIRKGKKLSDFRTGLTIFGNLKQKRIIGGIVLNESEFCLRG